MPPDSVAQYFLIAKYVCGPTAVTNSFLIVSIHLSLILSPCAPGESIIVRDHNCSVKILRWSPPQQRLQAMERERLIFKG